MNEIRPHHTEAVSLKEWLVTNLIMMIPLVNIIMMLVWAFSSGTNPSKANYFKSQLILAAVLIVIMLVVWVLAPSGQYPQ